MINIRADKKYIRDIFGNDQEPWKTLPDIKSTYVGSDEEMIACYTIAEGIIQRHIGFDKYKKKISQKSLSYAPFLLKNGIPYENGNFNLVLKQKLFGNCVGNGRKVRLMVFRNDPNVWYYTVETDMKLFCRKIVPRKAGSHVRLHPKINIYSTEDFESGHDIYGYTKIPKSKDQDVSHKFKVW